MSTMTLTEFQQTVNPAAVEKIRELKADGHVVLGVSSTAHGRKVLHLRNPEGRVWGTYLP